MLFADIRRNERLSELFSAEDMRSDLLTSAFPTFARDFETTAETLPPPAEFTDLLGKRLTKHGQAVGTPIYMSPEQFTGKKVKGSADIYSLGATLFHCLTGRLAINEQDAIHQGQKAIKGEYKHLLNMVIDRETDGVSEEMAALVDWMMEIKANNRPTAQEIVEQLGNIKSGKPVSRVITERIRKARRKKQSLASRPPKKVNANK